jgi:enamine deaminase RidA (YjgF/YER057c/UK114 family)
VLAGRERAFALHGQSRSAPRPQVVQQPPASHRGAFAVAAHALIPHGAAGWRVQDLDVATGCGCEDCARSGARLVRLGSQQTLYTTRIPGTGDDPEEQVASMFRTAERLLAGCGMTFRHVVRTWIHLRDIDRDYDVLNAARRRFFRDAGVDLRPASTGVAGALAAAAHDVSMSLIALHAGDADAALDVAPVSTPLLNEAWSYGADFSRGLRVTDANKVAIHVSGTASLDDSGRTVHVGDFAAQADRMLHNIATLLAGQGAGFADVVSGVTYLRHAGDAARLRPVYRRHGFDDFAHVLVEAPLCRPDLLCEAEVLALLPLATATA